MASKPDSGPTRAGQSKVQLGRQYHLSWGCDNRAKQSKAKQSRAKFNHLSWGCDSPTILSAAANCPRLDVSAALLMLDNNTITLSSGWSAETSSLSHEWEILSTHMYDIGNSVQDDQLHPDSTRPAVWVKTGLSWMRRGLWLRGGSKILEGGPEVARWP